MLCASRNEKGSIIVDRGHDCADRCSDMPLLIDITIIQHGVPSPANVAIALCLALHEYRPDAARLFCRNLGLRRKAHIPGELGYANEV